MKPPDRTAVLVALLTGRDSWTYVHTSEIPFLLSLCPSFQALQKDLEDLVIKYGTLKEAEKVICNGAFLLFSLPARNLFISET